MAKRKNGKTSSPVIKTKIPAEKAKGSYINGVWTPEVKALPAPKKITNLGAIPGVTAAGGGKAITYVAHNYRLEGAELADHVIGTCFQHATDACDGLIRHGDDYETIIYRSAETKLTQLYYRHRECVGVATVQQSA